ncbi:MAG: Brp/Blh family beta-carotene 15,15'-dioxygenase [Bacteroidota bacterium]
MVLTGIPHGATDHLVFQQLFPHLSPVNFWLRFLGQYLGLIGLYAILWWWMPLLSLGLFLGFSFYHFGQSELFFLPISENSWLKKGLYLCWGGCMLLLMLFSHLEESLLILQNLSQVSWLREEILVNWLPVLIGVMGGFTLLGMIYLGIRYPRIQRDLLLEFGLSLLLIGLVQATSLLLAFAIYFGLWHAGKTIWMEIMMFRREKKDFSIGQWVKAALPFSLISFSGIGGLLLISQWEGLPLSPVLLFFIMISLLTLPHMNLLGALYNKV